MTTAGNVKEEEQYPRHVQSVMVQDLLPVQNVAAEVNIDYVVEAATGGLVLVVEEQENALVAVVLEHMVVTNVAVQVPYPLLVLVVMAMDMLHQTGIIVATVLAQAKFLDKCSVALVRGAKVAM